MVLTENEKADRPLTVDETAEYLRLNKNTVLKLIKEGKIKAARFGRVWRIQRSEINRILNGE